MFSLFSPGRNAGVKKREKVELFFSLYLRKTGRFCT
jgi:hypothetical protein